jgi:hypothetical protein
VEVSLDSGVTWSLWTSATIFRRDRAALYLDDPVLPAGYLTAARAGAVRVRVTASLRCPAPVTKERWMGNPFAGVLPRRTIEAGEVFAFRRVDEGSIHSSAVRDHTLAAAEADDSALLDDWLLARMADGAEGEGDATIRLDLHGAWFMLQPGDRLRHAGGPGLDASGASQAVSDRGAVVREVRCVYPGPHDRGPAATQRTHIEAHAERH